MSCSLSHSDSEVESLVQKLIDEDNGRQNAIMSLALQFENSCTAKKDLIKSYKKCTHISQESRALIDSFLKKSSDKDYELNLSMYEKAAKLEKQKDAKLAWLMEKYYCRSQKSVGSSSSYGDPYLTEKELYQLRLNWALLFKWVWRYLSQDNSLWYRIISAIHGLDGKSLTATFNSSWSSIIKEINSLKNKGVDLVSHCKKQVGRGISTSFWNDLWIGDTLLKVAFPRIFALETNKDILVADKFDSSLSSSFRRPVRGGEETHQFNQLSNLISMVSLSSLDDRLIWDISGDRRFQVKSVRSLLDDSFLPKMGKPTRWIKSIPIKVNVFAWKLSIDRLATRSNLIRRNITVPDVSCPLCDHEIEDSNHLFFNCFMAKEVRKQVCKWWYLDDHPYDSYEGWLSWFNSVRLGSKLKDVLEGVFYVSWWSIWYFRNQLLFSDTNPRKDVLFDNITLLSFNWCKARSCRSLNWVNWLQHPYLSPM